jgi:glycerol-3-phosphate acyltransferase PlsY
MTAALAILASYLLGSIPSAYLITRSCCGIDIRKVGDFNAGASNVAREIGPAMGWLVLFADAAKGAAAVLLARALASESVVLVCGAAVVAGHNWPLFLKFRGGRGMATVIGVLFVLLPLPMAAVSLVGGLVLWLTRSIVIAGLVTFIPLLVLALLLGASPALLGYVALLLCSAGIMHLVTTHHLTAEQKKQALRWQN